jgi:alkylation response protein AidB-like acyl-CoA dehydrogenase
MDFSLSDEQVLLRDSAERFAREHFSLEARRRQIASGSGFNRQNWGRFAELGWLAMPLPDDAGGLGGDFVDVAILLMALGRGCPLEPYIPTAILGADLIKDSPRRDELLPKVADGGLRLALAHDEAGERHELGRPRATSARPTDGGYRITGAKTMVLGGSDADQLLVTASLPGADGFALFLVAPEASGVRRAPYALIDGTGAADFAFEDVALPADALLAGPDVAPNRLEAAIDRATLALLAEAVGSIEACLDLCNSYIKSRQQFGQPLGKFQALQHMMAEMFVEAQEARSSLYFALSHIDSEPTARRRAVSTAKIIICSAGQLVTRHGVQLHGGYGVTDEFAISHHYRRQMVIEKVFGDLQHHLSRLAACDEAK